YHTHGSVSGRALFYEEYRKASALGTTLTNTTAVPKEEVAAVAAWILLEPLLEVSAGRALRGRRCGTRPAS
ncbi:hypothetical protein LCGC14_1924640, partial [marine sediment metagenome]